jgi:predicted transcriptional regulator
MPKTNLIDLFEKAKTFNKFLILYLLRDKKPRSKEEIIDEIQSERQMFRNTILMAIDSLYINKLIIQTEDKYTIPGCD